MSEQPDLPSRTDKSNKPSQCSILLLHRNFLNHTSHKLVFALGLCRSCRVYRARGRFCGMTRKSWTASGPLV